MEKLKTPGVAKLIRAKPRYTHKKAKHGKRSDGRGAKRYPRIEALGIKRFKNGWISHAELNRVLPPNSPSRKMFDFAFGIQTGAFYRGKLCLYPWDVERALTGLPVED